MEVKIWYIKFGMWANISVIAPNAKKAIDIALIKMKDDEWKSDHTLSDITSVELEASAEK